MAGHSHWKQIQRQKGATDQKRGQIFSKLLKAVSIAAKKELNPNFNPRLRSAIEKAKENKIPNENIKRAIRGASENKNLEEIIIEAYGPEKSALIIEAITDNKNRTVSELRHLLSQNNAKMANSGSVLWSFDPPAGGKTDWTPKFQQPISEEGKKQVRNIISKIEEHDDVQKVITNI